MLSPHQIETERFGKSYEIYSSCVAKTLSKNEEHDGKDTEELTKGWRLRERERAKTIGAALIACLNIGFDPPDVVRPNPCARMECWMDPTVVPKRHGRKLIGVKLQAQYERWQSRAKYRVAVDPTPEEIRKLCINLRRTAEHDRVLFHYNGHGVPKPTANGELWAYNKTYTQYVPFLIYDLQSWMGVADPSIYVFDCSSAGFVIEEFQQFLRQREENLPQLFDEPQTNNANNSNNNMQGGNVGIKQTRQSIISKESLDSSSHSFAKDCQHILLGACSANETLSVSADYPADIFTSCLTTPIKMALYWFSRRSKLTNMTMETIDSIPGLRKPNNRKTPFGELNWIFTAITDCIAWDVLPRDLFHRLFRQDLLVASLFRNFLLAQRIIRSFNLTAVSAPKLPDTHLHPMWKSWDLAVELSLANLLKNQTNNTMIQFRPNTFFADQLTSIDLWLTYADENSPPPLQLPILLQVLLSPSYRLRALQLLICLLDKGNWAINQALSVGIFPYVLKLLLIPDRELREVLVFVWVKILIFDPSCQKDLVKADYSQYFLSHFMQLKTNTITNSDHAPSPPPNSRVASPSTNRRTSPSSLSRDRLKSDDWSDVQASSRNSSSLSSRKNSFTTYDSLLDERSLLEHSPKENKNNNQNNNQNNQNNQNKQENESHQSVSNFGKYESLQHPSSPNTPYRNINDNKSSLFGNNKVFLRDPDEESDRIKFTKGVVQQAPFQRVLIAFIVSAIANNHLRGQHAIATSQYGGISIFARFLDSKDALTRLWMCLAISKIWHNFDEVKLTAIREDIPMKISLLLEDSHHEVRAAACYALGTFMGGKERNGSTTHIFETTTSSPPQQQQSLSSTPAVDDDIIQQQNNNQNNNTQTMDVIQLELTLGLQLSKRLIDGSHIVRREATLSLCELLFYRQEMFLSLISNDGKTSNMSSKHRQIWVIWKSISALCKDPHPDVNSIALSISKYMKNKSILSSQLESMTSKNKRPSAGKPITVVSNVNNNDDIDNTAQQPPSVGVSVGNGNTVQSQPLAGSPSSRRDSLQLKHFDRHKMAHLQRAHKTRVDGGNLRRNNLKLTILRNLEYRDLERKREQLNGDERTSDPLWDIPCSLIHEESSVRFKQPLLSSLLFYSLNANDYKLTNMFRKDDNEQFQVDVPKPLTMITGFQEILTNSPPIKHKPKLNTTRNNTNNNHNDNNSDDIDASKTFSIQKHYPAISEYHPQTLQSHIRTKENAKLLYNHHFDSSSSTKWSEVCYFQAPWEATSSIALHPFENVLVATSNTDNVGVWQYGGRGRTPRLLNQFHNNNTLGSRISSLHFLNEFHKSLLLCASDEGVVRIYRNFYGKEELVTAWHAFSDREREFKQSVPTNNIDSRKTSNNNINSTPKLLTSSRSSTILGTPRNRANSNTRRVRCSPVVTCWGQSTGLLAISAHTSDIVKVWDVERGMCVLDLPFIQEESGLKSDRLLGINNTSKGYVTDMCFNKTEQLLFVGYRDGYVRLLDTRINPLQQQNASILVEEKSKIVHVSLHSMLEYTFCAATRNGLIIQGDLRKSEHPNENKRFNKFHNDTNNNNNGQIEAFTSHPYAQIFASSDSSPSLEFIDYHGEVINSIKYHSGFLEPRIGVTNALSFHKHKLILAAGSCDSNLTILDCEDLVKTY